jgi:hypothetical protein
MECAVVVAAAPGTFIRFNNNQSLARMNVHVSDMSDRKSCKLNVNQLKSSTDFTKSCVRELQQVKRKIDFMRR